MYDDVVKYSLRLPGMVVLLHNKDLCGAGHFFHNGKTEFHYQGNEITIVTVLRTILPDHYQDDGSMPMITEGTWARVLTTTTKQA